MRSCSWITPTLGSSKGVPDPRMSRGNGVADAWPGAAFVHAGTHTVRARSQPGWLKVAMELRLEPTTMGTVLSTETRVLATGAKSRRASSKGWFFTRLSSADDLLGILENRRPPGGSPGRGHD